MSQSIITTAFEQWKAQEAAGGNTVVVDEFVLALVPGLDPNAPIDRSEGLPPAGQIVHRQAVNKTGVVNQNAVVYSITLGTEIGDFDFNWIGLVNKTSGTVAMIVHAPTQRKIANANGQQGNALTRSFLMEYDGAASETGITVPAETWQIDFTARLTGIDEMQRLINLDHYGPGAFFADSFLVAKTGQQYYVTAGSAYVGGLRAVLAANKNITVSAKPVKVWADVSLQGNVVSQWESVVTLRLAATLADYRDNAGFMHRVFAVASIDAAGNITDLRPQGSLTEQETSDALAQHEKSRNHPDGTLTEKGFVQMSSATDSDSETLAATSKAAKIAMDNGNARLAKERNGADIPNAALFRQNLALKGAALVDIGKTAGTAAAGDDSRIVDAISIKNTNIQLPGNLGVRNLEVHPMPNSAEGGEINLYDKDNKQAAYIDIDSDGNFRVVTDGVGATLTVNRTTGNIVIPKTLTAVGILKGSGIIAEGTVYAGNAAAWLAADGNIYGPVWGGYLSTYLSNRGVRAWAAVQGNGTIISSFGFAAINRTNVGGYNFTMSTSNGAYAVTVGINGGSQNGAISAHSANIWNRTPNSFSIQNANDGGTSYDWRDWPEFYVIVVGP
ncbi:phage tail-collar fiber domain-containing protein [Yersinia enterocolitica]|uniref:phage tail-collar fiber domain-containing protein n=1 Tax=Yersinia enterocolitica TaxID=630 RepID=UPI000327EA8B|nr:phage tail protein [Yersinia enterocolitica]CCV60038.1 probable tail fiber protein [Yersinia enterocolitica (type O:2) str. YE3094/96]